MGEYDIRKAISLVKLEDEAEHERNIENLAQEDDDYKSPELLESVTAFKPAASSFRGDL